MLHAAIRGLNSLADLEMLHSFNEKYFDKSIEDRSPILLEVLQFEEEILRQKITWKEKYESVISGWISPKSAKSKLKMYEVENEQNRLVESKTESVKVSESSVVRDAANNIKTEKSLSPGSAVNEKNVVDTTKEHTPVPNETDDVHPTAENNNAAPSEKNKLDAAAAEGNELGATEGKKPVETTTEETKPAVNAAEGDKLAPVTTEDVKPDEVENNKPDENNTEKIQSGKDEQN